ncbi:MAG: excinuclease ABC subunit UvrB [Culicoidibacterales bacterium]
MTDFQIKAPFEPSGDQPAAIEALVAGLENGEKQQILLGATGTGKTFTMSQVIQRVNRPTIVIAHNKTLAGQLYSELKEFFPNNAVEYFVSNFDYYQPEAYKPSTDTYIQKDAQVNDEVEKLRYSATTSLLERRDVIVVASVSCIYGIGSPEEYKSMLVSVRIGQEWDRQELMRALIDIQYQRNDIEFARGTFRVRGDVLEIIPIGQDEAGIRIEFFGDEIERISEIELVTGKILVDRQHIAILPASHYVTKQDTLAEAISRIEAELAEQLAYLNKEGKLLEAQRLEQRTNYDLEMLREMGFCTGVENYSRHLTLREADETPFCLLDFFPDDYLMIIDESHVSIPQIGGMYFGDRSRKEMLVSHGFRLPSALDNRPLRFEEFIAKTNQIVYVSATPGKYELEYEPKIPIIQQIIRPTGLLDPEITIKPTKNQIDDLLAEIHQRITRNERVLVTTLTIKMSEQLTKYFKEQGIKVAYLHSEIKTLERIAIIRDLRLGKYDVLVGINLLREGIDIPEVSLIAILDADKEGFLRSERSLIQIVGRAARNEHGHVIMYADKMTNSMEAAISETQRRRDVQQQYNQVHGITPKTIIKEIRDVIAASVEVKDSEAVFQPEKMTKSQRMKLIERLRKEMKEAAAKLDFETATQLRDAMMEIEATMSK